MKLRFKERCVYLRVTIRYEQQAHSRTLGITSVLDEIEYSMINLYWPIYKNLEREVVELSNQIHFDDIQLSVYSVKICELLLRCVVEVEAISKDLYFKNGGIQPIDRDLYFDTDCLNLLEDKWNLSKKQIIVSSVNFYFDDVDNKVLTPLRKANKRGTSAADWEKAYQAVKHNRTQNLSKGNIKHLIRAMAALFLLNLYYREDVFDLAKNNNPGFAEKLSDLFNVKVHTWRGDMNQGNSYLKHEDFDECTYLVKWKNDYKLKWNELKIEENKNLIEIIFNHPKVRQYINDNLMENGLIKSVEYTKFIENQEFFNCFDMKKEYGKMIDTAYQKASTELKFDPKVFKEYEAVLVKNQQVYSLTEPMCLE